MHRQRHSGTFLLVEGLFDRLFFNPFVDRSICEIVTCDGKENLIATHEILRDFGFPGFICIADSNCDKLQGCTLSESDFIYTDHHDLEMMIFNSPAINDVINAYANPERLIAFAENTGATIIESLQGACLEIGYLRWLSIREDLQLDFKNLRYSRFLNKPTLRVHLENLIISVLNNSSRQDLDIANICDQIEQLKQITADPLDICNGHDLIELLKIAFSRSIGNHSRQSMESIERSLIPAYRMEYLNTTQLHQDITSWASCNPGYLVFA